MWNYSALFPTPYFTNLNTFTIMKVTLELSTESDATSKVGTTYKVSNVRFDDTVDVEITPDTKLTAEENAKYVAMAEALAEYYSGRTLVLQPAD